MLTIFTACIESVTNGGVQTQAMFTTEQTAQNWLMKQMNTVFSGKWDNDDDVFSWTDDLTGILYQAYVYEDNVFDSVHEEQAAVDERLRKFNSLYSA